MTGPTPIIALHGVSKAFGTQDALLDVHLSVAPGEFLTLLGPSGCGKTTLLRLVAGFETPDAGEIHLDGQRVDHLPPNKRAVHTVFQSYALFPHLTVLENVAFSQTIRGAPRRQAHALAREALALVHLEDLAQRRPQALSGGQQQRVALARAMVNKPKALLLDEPLSALDQQLRKQMQRELKQLQRDTGIAFLLVTHDQEEALSLSDRVAVLQAGRIRQLDTPAAIYERPADLFTARFVGEINVFEGVALGARDGRLLARVLGREMLLAADPAAFAPGRALHVLLRPEDMRLRPAGEPAPAHGEDLPEPRDLARAVARDTVYKGATYDIALELDAAHGGGRLVATRFFDEDDETMHIRPGDAVLVDWVAGWEVVLPHETHG